MKKSRFEEMKEHNLRASPLYASFYLSLAEMVDNRQPTMYTDGKVVGYNQEFLDKLSLNEGDTALCHEVLHVMFRHPQHAKKFLAWMSSHGMDECWPCINHAGDEIINASLLKEGKTPLPAWCWMMDPDGGAEDRSIYDQIPRVYAREHHKHKGKGDGKDGAEGGGHGNGCCKPLPKGMSDAELAEYDQQVTDAIIQAAKAAKARGTLPGWAERLVQEVTVARVPYKQHLREWFDSRIPADFSWQKPSRQGMVSGCYLPRFSVEALGEICVMVDVSGSVDEHMLNIFCGHLKEIFSQCRPTKIHVLYVDAAVQKHEEFSGYDELVLKPVGGGGTSFRPGFEYLGKNGIEVRGVVYLTDLYGDWKEMADPGIPTLFVTPTKEDQTKDLVGSWGRVLHVPEGEV